MGKECLRWEFHFRECLMKTRFYRNLKKMKECGLPIWGKALRRGDTADVPESWASGSPGGRGDQREPWSLQRIPRKTKQA